MYDNQSNKKSFPMQDVFLAIIEDLKFKYQPHTLLLYGSYADDDANAQSDIDIACFCDNTPEQKDARWVNGVYLDAWVYPTASMDTIEAEHLRFAKGKLLYDAKGLGAAYLQRIQDFFDQGPSPLSIEDRQHLNIWVEKMLRRCTGNDIDSHYRRQRLQVELLEIYFQWRDLWFLGHKKSFRQLQKQDPTGYTLFFKVYQNPTDAQNLQELVAHVMAQHKNENEKSRDTF